MRICVFVGAVVLGLCSPSDVSARQVPLPPEQVVGTPLEAPRLDPNIIAAISQITADRLREIDTHLVAFGTRSTFSTGAGRRRGVFAARDWIAGAFEAVARRTHGRMTVSLDTYVEPANGKTVLHDTPISSVIATLRGEESENRTYVMSSHFDSRNSIVTDATGDAPGADDNGSGTAAVLEAARVLSNLPLHATIVFAVFDAEEQGLYGSNHFAQELKARGTNMAGDLNNDIIGASVGPGGEMNPHVVRIFSQALADGSKVREINAAGNENDSPSRELARAVKAIGDAYVPDLSGMLVARADRFLRGGDHESFNAAGFAALRFTEPVENFAHQHQDVRSENGIQYGDLQQFMDFAYLTRVTRYNAASLAALATGPAQPHDAAILTQALTNTTTLSWSAVAGAINYEVVRRATTDADWTSATGFGNVTTATLPFSKDNWLFGIRAVDAQGNRSIVSFPVPRRN